MTPSSLEQSDAEAAAVQRTPNRVTLEGMKDKIANVEYINPESAPLLTIAVVTVSNGFTLVGKAASADPENHNAELGQKFAFEDAIRQMWPFEGYLLRQKLHEAA